MSFDSDERSISGSRPVDLFSATLISGTVYWTSNVVDVTFGGTTYTATTSSRGDVGASNDPSGDEMVIYLPADHIVSQSLIRNGIGEQQVKITYHRLQTVSNERIQGWAGYAQSLAVDPNYMVSIRVPSLVADLFKIRLPVISAQRFCNHRLFDSQCSPGLDDGVSRDPGPDPNDYRVSGIISSVSADGLTLTFSISQPNGWATFGQLILANGERRRVVSQVGNVIVINMPFGNFINLATLEAGCNHDISTCTTKFANRFNYGGHPQINTSPDLYVPAGLGIIQQV